MSNLNQRQVQKLLQKLSPQQIQMIKLLELPALQLEQRIKQETFSFLCCSRSVFLTFALDQRRHRFGDGLAVRVKEEHLDLCRLRPVGVRPLERHGFFILRSFARGIGSMPRFFRKMKQQIEAIAVMLFVPKSHLYKQKQNNASQLTIRRD